MILPLLLLLQTAAPPQTISPGSKILIDRLRAADARAQAGNCAGALADLPAETDLPAALRVPTLRFRFGCLAQLRRMSDAMAVRNRLVAAGDRTPAVIRFPIARAFDEGRYADAAGQMIDLADRGSVDLASVDSRLWLAVSRALIAAGDDAMSDRLGLSLARAAWTPVDQIDVRPQLSMAAIRALLAQGRVDEAAEFVDAVADPDYLYDLAIERQYEPLWPRIERRIGAQGAAAADRQARRALPPLAERPTDPQLRYQAMLAYRALGRMEDAARLGDAIDPARIVDRYDVSALLIQADALRAIGDERAAEARLRSASNVPGAPAAASDGEPAVYAAIALADLLDQQGRDADALAAATGALAMHKAVLWPFATAWLQRSRACSLARLGRMKEAQAVTAALRAALLDNEAAAIEASLCLGEVDAAARAAIRTLNRPRASIILAKQFQPTASRPGRVPSRLTDQWALLLRRPDVRTAFDRIARILPPELWPDPTPRPLPVLPRRGESSTS